MFLCSFRMSKLKIFGIFTIILAVAIVAIILITSLNSSDSLPEPTMPPEEMMMVESNEQMADFLEYFGWTVVEEPTETAEVTIPKEFDEVYQNYNEIQKNQGFDLEEMKGKTVQRVVFLVTNYPDQTNVYAHLLVCEGKVVGGDVCSTELEGFMHGFAKP